MAALETHLDASSNPLDLVEKVAGSRDWMIERSNEDEINLVVTGSWCEFYLSLNWHPDMQGLHLACTFDLKVPAARREEVSRAISIINEQLFYGHFDIWRQDGTLLFRHALPLSGGAVVTDEQADGMLITAVHNCERYFPVFQFVIWAGKTAEQALQASMLETLGQA